MMKSLRYSTRAKKDLKKYRNQPQKMRRLFAVIEMLLKGEKLPPSFRKHELSGRYAGALECHMRMPAIAIYIMYAHARFLVICGGRRGDVVRIALQMGVAIPQRPQKALPPVC